MNYREKTGHTEIKIQWSHLQKGHYPALTGVCLLLLPEIQFSAIRNLTENLQEAIHDIWSEAHFYVRKPSSG